MPARGKRRAIPTQHTADTPTQRLIITREAVGVGRPRSPRAPEFLRGEDLALIRPYLIAYERAHGIYHQAVTA
jgi:hypothetical protein